MWLKSKRVDWANWIRNLPQVERACKPLCTEIKSWLTCRLTRMWLEDLRVWHLLNCLRSRTLKETRPGISWACQSSSTVTTLTTLYSRTLCQYRSPKWRTRVSSTRKSPPWMMQALRRRESNWTRDAKCLKQINRSATRSTFLRMCKPNSHLTLKVCRWLCRIKSIVKVLLSLAKLQPSKSFN